MYLNFVSSSLSVSESLKLEVNHYGRLGVMLCCVKSKIWTSVFKTKKVNSSVNVFTAIYAYAGWLASSFFSIYEYAFCVLKLRFCFP